MKNGIVKLEAPELQVIEKSKAAHIKATFEPMVAMLSEFEGHYNEIISESEKEITKEITAKAKRLRIDIGRVRIETGKLKDEQKAEYLRAGNAIQAVHNILVWAVTDKENKLKEIENYFEIQERKRLDALQSERVGKLLPYHEDADLMALSGMEEDVWQAYFQAKKKEYEDKIQAEKQAELDRIARDKAEEEERARIKAENERLKAEAEAKAKADKIEADKRAKLEKERAEKEEAERLKRDKEANEERSRRVKLEAELKAKEEAERKVKAEAEAKIQAELNKGDSEKVKDLVTDLNNLKTKYIFKSSKNQKMYSDVGVLIDKVINHIQKS